MVPLRIPAPLLALGAACAVAVGGCGGSGAGGRAAASGEEQPFVSLSEAERVLLREGGGRLGRDADAGQPGMGGEVTPRPVDSATLSTAGGGRFDLLVFATPSAGERAAKRIGRGWTARAANVVAVFPTEDAGRYRSLDDALRTLDEACGGRAGDGASLRRVCFGSDGESVEVGGVRYEIVASRVMDSAKGADRRMLKGRKPGDGRRFVGVFLRACSPTGESGTSTTLDGFRLVDDGGDRLAPTELPAGNGYDYTPQRVGARLCSPPPGSAAESAAGGRFVLFEPRTVMLRHQPLTFEVRVGDVARRLRVLL